ncbi:MAG: (2Fe-2S) ferredoxin domain-containing protein [Gemmataceae bacterium]|nr:(2Fe-2S) ferredoxin domain-containing protein [Gemmataceae bacterium]MDW8267331.1 (2Fe-2S) ferredoxin domain-containing protein [Gemmataceae bacterium]
MPDPQDALRAAATKLGIGGYRRHVLLCIGDSCCSSKEGEAAWDALKGALKAHGLGSGPNACYRSKVGCLRICCQGPILVVYPEGTWYHGMTAERIPRLVREHLLEGRPIREWIFAENPLPAAPA